MSYYLCKNSGIHHAHCPNPGEFCKKISPRRDFREKHSKKSSDDFGRTLSVAPCGATAPPRGELNSLSQNLTVLPAPSGREPLAWRQSFRHNAKASPWGSFHRADRITQKSSPLRGKTSPAPGEDVTAGDKKGNLASRSDDREGLVLFLIH